MKKLVVINNKRIFAFGLIFGLALIFRTYKINSIPGEIFGDIVENLKHQQDFLEGDFNIIYGWDAREFLFYFVNTALSLVLGNSYLVLKINCVLIGLVSILSTYLLVKEIVGEKQAIISALFMSFSKWPVIFSRIGFRVVLVPLWTSLAFLFYTKAIKNKRLRDYIIAGLFFGSGLYIYPAFRFAIVAVFISCVWQLLYKKEYKNNLVVGLIIILVSAPMIVDYTHKPIQYVSHSKPMLFLENDTLRQDWMIVFVENIINQAKMFNFRGDIVFRINPTKSPMLDPISGIFFLVGLIGLSLDYIKAGNRRLIVASSVFLPFIILQLPSVLVLNYPVDIPSATRSMGILSFVFLFIGVGFVKIFKNWKGTITKVLVVSTVVVIMLINWKHYFEDYKLGLPNRNVVLSQEIVNHLRDQNEIDTYIVGCCWGEWGQGSRQEIDILLSKIKPINVFYIDSFDKNVLDQNRKIQMIMPPEPFRSVQSQRDYDYEIITDQFGQKLFAVVKNFN